MNKRRIVGMLLILLGVIVLALLAGFIVHIIETLLKLIAVFIGILLIVAGVALLVGRSWMRGGDWRRGSPTLST